MELKVLNNDFTICKIKDVKDILNIFEVNFESEFYFLSKTDEELSLVCETEFVPKHIIEADYGWKAFRIQGVLDFSLIGILSKLSTILAENRIGIFAVSTFNTDYILVKEKSLEKAISALEKEGYCINK